MLDKSIPDIRVLMTKDNVKEYPRYTQPSGYSFSLYEEGDENSWAELHFLLEQFKSVDEARQYFEKEYLEFPNEVGKKCVFVKDEVGNIIATTSVWRGQHFGKVLQRVHWVAVHPLHQGKGIAKALMTKVLDIYNDIEHGDFIYLTSQTWSYKAINIYLEFGFKPYIGQKPANWGGSSQQFDKDKIQGWEIIMDKIDGF